MILHPLRVYALNPQTYTYLKSQASGAGPAAKVGMEDVLDVTIRGLPIPKLDAPDQTDLLSQEDRNNLLLWTAIVVIGLWILVWFLTIPSFLDPVEVTMYHAAALAFTIGIISIQERYSRMPTWVDQDRHLPEALVVDSRYLWLTTVVGGKAFDLAFLREIESNDVAVAVPGNPRMPSSVVFSLRLRFRDETTDGELLLIFATPQHRQAIQDGLNARNPSATGIPEPTQVPAPKVSTSIWLRPALSFGIAGLLWYPLLQLNTLLRDDAMFEAITYAQNQPGDIRLYLLDGRNTRHRQELQQRLDEYYSTVTRQLTTRPGKDEPLRQKFVALMQTINKLPQPVATFRLRIQPPLKAEQLNATTQAQEFRDKLREACSPQLLEFMNLDDDKIPALIEASLTSEPWKNQHLLTWRVEVREKFDAVPQVWVRRKLSPTIAGFADLKQFIRETHLILVGDPETRAMIRFPPPPRDDGGIDIPAIAIPQMEMNPARLPGREPLTQTPDEEYDALQKSIRDEEARIAALK